MCGVERELEAPNTPRIRLGEQRELGGCFAASGVARRRELQAERWPLTEREPFAGERHVEVRYRGCAGEASLERDLAPQGLVEREKRRDFSEIDRAGFEIEGSSTLREL